MSLMLDHTEDFELISENKEKFKSARWNVLKRAGGEKEYQTRFKALYSKTGIYFLAECADSEITSTLKNDGEDLYTEDVLEFFVQPDRRYPVYLEYELSPRNRELVLMVSHNGAKFYGWTPFHYTGERKTAHIVWNDMHRPESSDAFSLWGGMIYLPFVLFEGVAEHIPQSGDVWYGNIFRIDYDGGEISRYAFAPGCGTEFHDFRKFEEILFL